MSTPTTVDYNIVSISASYGHSLAIDALGNIHATGSNDAGQLGLGDYTDRESFW
jgi:alpha-tubulin suppressor-like RCC1 family protein